MTETKDWAARLVAIEDKLSIYNLLASQPPLVESGDKELLLSIFTPDGVLDRGELGSTSVSDMRADYERIGMREALQQGLAHLAGMPYVVVRGDTALAISYILTMMPDPVAEEISLPGHGKGRGHRILRVLANRWELRKLNEEWKVERRILCHHNGSGAATDLLKRTLDEMRTPTQE